MEKTYFLSALKSWGKTNMIGYGNCVIYTFFFILLAINLLLFLYAQIQVYLTYNKYWKIANSKELNGGDAAQLLLQKEHIIGVKLEIGNEKLIDYYDPSSRLFRLAPATCKSKSIAAIANAAHESAHIINYEDRSFFVKTAQKFKLALQISAAAAFILLILGYYLPGGGALMAWGAILGIPFLTANILLLLTELDVSAKALTLLKEHELISGAEEKTVEAALQAAALRNMAIFIPE